MSLQLDVEANVLELLDHAYLKRGDDLNKSLEISYHALALSRNLQNPSLIGKCLTKISLYHMISAENEKAIAMSEEAIQYFAEDNDELGIANANYNIAGVYYKTNNYHLGMFHLIDCLTIYRKYGDKHNESRAHKSLGTIFEILGDQPNAIVAYENAINCAQQAENLNLESNVYNPLSGILLKQKKINLALNLITKSISIKISTGDRRGYAFAVYGRGKILTYLEKYSDALSDFQEALAIHREVDDVFGIAMCYNKIAHLFVRQGDSEKAKFFLKKAIDLSDKNELSVMKYKCYHFMYSIYKDEGNTKKALNYLEKYIDEKDDAVNSQTLKVIENYERISKLQSKENQARLERQKFEIAQKQERAEQTAAMKQNFLSAMSHEIRTPLNAITSIISLLHERSDEGEKELLTSLQFSSKNLLRIINDILDFSKLESDNMQLEIYPVEFKKLLNNIKQTYSSLADEKNIKLSLTIDPKVSEAYLLDETKLFQILGNLISNAIKFTDNGGIKINVILDYEGDQYDTITFEVIDTGIGISPEEQEKLFESFYIPKSITTRNDGGTGLGLAIVKKLVELHNSSIRIKSEVNAGSTFLFKFNLEKTSIPFQYSKQEKHTLMGKVAILAEDNKINALVMNKLLTKWGVKIKRVKNGLEAVKIASEERVDFILMDIHMPELNGFDATRSIRTIPNVNQTTPIFALTADVTAANSHEYAHHFNGFLWKPIEIDKLFKALTQVQKINNMLNETTTSKST
ncbi:ATP-binding protein [Dokdonia sp. Hel_I_53]|uniref:tetratricopeptide repeat-containing hybrid sensor histidine kinase/response regulator n=1 Tax=Dokdonia sp. Hel_I_53 TaxID=1566287 RepID=UPI00119A869A|nr:ATP-binding protein [Dokdonia sp. Hel_I_53]TVZ53334.1 signal transduction histidine kinase [Dokdonia sp. Hel_I_53]